MRTIDNAYEFCDAIKDKPEFKNHEFVQQIISGVSALRDSGCACNKRSLSWLVGNLYRSINSFFSEEDRTLLRLILQDSIRIQDNGTLLIEIL